MHAQREAVTGYLAHGVCVLPARPAPHHDLALRLCQVALHIRQLLQRSSQPLALAWLVAACIAAVLVLRGAGWTM